MNGFSQLFNQMGEIAFHYTCKCMLRKVQKTLILQNFLLRTDVIKTWYFCVRVGGTANIISFLI